MYAHALYIRMYAHTYVCMHCMYICMYAHACTYCMYVCTCMYVLYVCTCMYICMYAHVCSTTYMRVTLCTQTHLKSMYAGAYMCMHVQVHTKARHNTYACTYINRTHTHTIHECVMFGWLVTVSEMNGQSLFRVSTT